MRPSRPRPRRRSPHPRPRPHSRRPRPSRPRRARQRHRLRRSNCSGGTTSRRSCRRTSTASCSRTRTTRSTSSRSLATTWSTCSPAFAPRRRWTSSTSVTSTTRRGSKVASCSRSRRRTRSTPCTPTCSRITPTRCSGKARSTGCPTTPTSTSLPTTRKWSMMRASAPARPRWTNYASRLRPSSKRASANFPWPSTSPEAQTRCGTSGCIPSPQVDTCSTEDLQRPGQHGSAGVGCAHADADPG